MNNSSGHRVCKERDGFLLFLSIRFWAMALVIGLGFALLLQDQGENWIVSILAGASGGVCISFLVCHSTWLIYMRITRGGTISSRRPGGDNRGSTRGGNWTSA
jgi:hypothetical protein